MNSKDVLLSHELTSFQWLKAVGRSDSKQITNGEHENQEEWSGVLL